MPFPDSVCFGRPFEGSTVIRNNGDCPGTFRIRYDSGVLGTLTSEEVELQPGQEHEFSVDITEMPDRAVDIEQFAELKVGDTWSPIDDEVLTVEPLFSDFQIVSAPYPSTTQPGDPVSANVTFQNVGDCAGELAVSATKLGRDVNVELEPGQSQSFRHEFSMPGDSIPVTLSVTNGDTGEEADSITEEISPSQTVILNTEEGTMKFIGGFDTNLSYKGVVQGTGISGEGLDSNDTLVGGRRVATFSGEVSTSPTDLDVINFDTLDLLNMQFGANIQWVKNNEILGEAESFQFSKYPVGALESQLPLPAENPEISIRASPTDRLGRVRTKLGVNTKLIKQPIISRVQRS